MIYTLTLNPAIDLYMEFDELKNNEVNRSSICSIIPNGKGVNVSFILKKLGIDSVALGVGGGFTNNYIEEALSENNIKNEFIHVPGNTRINAFAFDKQSNTEIKQLNSGPEVSEAQINELIKLLNKKITSNDYLVISGSFSKGIKKTVLEKICMIANEKEVNLVVDTCYKETLNILKYHPLLLKPNIEELAKWFNKSNLSEKEAKLYCQKLIEMGAQNVLLSMGGDGALFINEHTVIKGVAPKENIVNTAGAGDTMLGTFLGGMIQKKKVEDNFKYSIAAGSSTAFHIGLTDFDDCEKLEGQIKISTL